MSSVLDATSEDTREEALQEVAVAVRAGELVVVPTDTVYGIGCDAFSVPGVRALLEAKGRGDDMPPPVLVPNPRTLDGLAVDIPAYARDLVRAFWPGALTLVLRSQPSLTWDLGRTNGTVALRMPDDEVLLTLLAEVGPMAVSSANRTGEPAARTVLEAATQLGSSVAYYVDAGPRTELDPSTIIDCTGDSPVLLRAGAVDEDALAEILDRYAPADLEAGEPDPVEPSATDPDPTDDTRSTP